MCEMLKGVNLSAEMSDFIGWGLHQKTFAWLQFMKDQEIADGSIYLNELKQKLFKLPMVCNLSVADMFPRSWLEASYLEPFHLADLQVCLSFCARHELSFMLSPQKFACRLRVRLSVSAPPSVRGQACLT